MYRVITLVSFAVAVAFTWLLQVDAASAQIPQSLQQGGTDAIIKERKNAWTVGIAGGLIDGTYMRFADDRYGLWIGGKPQLARQR